MRLRLFSWNVNGLRAVLRKGALQDFLATARPDVLCLQEIKCTPSQLDPSDLAKLEATYVVHWHPAQRPGYSGTATFVRRGLPSSIIGSLQDISEQSELSDLAEQEGRIQVTNLKEFYLVNVYTPNSKPDLSRLSLRHRLWDTGFKDLLKQLETDKPVVACGDFNAAHTEIDLARPSTNHHSAGFTDEEREGVTNLLSAGFVDTFRSLHPEAQRYTWWSHWGKARENNVGWRIDYFFISQSLRPRLASAEIYEAQLGSDHCPISITLELPDAK